MFYKKVLGLRTTDLTAYVFFNLPYPEVPENWDILQSYFPQRGYHNALVYV